MDPNTVHGPDDSRPLPALPAAHRPPHGGPVRPVRLVSGDYLLTLNTVDGTEIEPCPPGERLPDVRKRPAAERPAGPLSHPVSAGPAPYDQPLWEREEERDQMVGLLSRGRSVRLVGPSGSGRSRLLDEVAAACADLAPDGVVRLSGAHRTSADLMHELFGAVHDAPRHRLDRAELTTRLAEIGAIVVLDDLEFGGEGLDSLLRATPECAFLLATTPDVPGPSADVPVAEVFLGGIGRDSCLTLVEHALGRPLTLREAEWASQLWFAAEGLPLRFVQAAAVLWSCDTARLGPVSLDGRDPVPGDRTSLPPVAEAAEPAVLLADRLGEGAREVLRLAVALGGEVPTGTQLAALVADTRGESALAELLGAGLISPVGGHYRLTAGVRESLAAAGYAEDATGRAHAVAQHYTWWAGQPSVSPERAAIEADVMLAALAALAPNRAGAHAATAVRLARVAAPVLAAALHWSAWERCLRHGQEAARLSGEVAQEAYFHHELGVLALCSGNLERARAELEASIGLRGVLSDRRGAVAGRRALALVADRTRALPPATPHTFAGTDVPESAQATGAQPAAHTPASGTDATTARVAGLSVEEMARLFPTDEPPPGTSGPTVSLGGASTVVQPVLAKYAGATPGGHPAPGGGKPGARRPVFSRARRNVVAAGAGALLAAALGTFVTLGATHDATAPSGGVKSEQSADDSDSASSGAPPATSHGSDPSARETTPSASASSPSPSATDGHAGTSWSTSGSSPDAPGSSSAGASHTPSRRPSHPGGTKTPSQKPTSPTTPPASPSQPTGSPEPSDSGDPSGSSSGGSRTTPQGHTRTATPPSGSGSSSQSSSPSSQPRSASSSSSADSSSPSSSQSDAPSTSDPTTNEGSTTNGDSATPSGDAS